MKASILIPLIAGAICAACRVGPEYETPAAETPARFAEAATNNAETEPELHRWNRFGDAELDKLVERALAQNLDLEVARVRVREARAERDAVAGESLPTLDANAGYSRNRTSNNGRIAGFGGDYDLFQAGFDATWEIDLFGRQKSALEAADLLVESAVESRRDALVTLLGEVAREYVDLRGTQRQLAITSSNLATQRDTLELTCAREQAGFSTALDTARAEALAASTAAAIPAFESRARASIHRLGVLLGEAPESLVDELSPAGATPVAPADVALGVPADLVRRRPDVRRAERDLARETALTAEATAELYPRLVLVGSAGQEARKASELFDTGSTTFSLGGSLTAPIFEGGRLRANLRAEDARRAEKLLAWRATVLQALREVEDALVSVARERERIVQLELAVDANRRAVALATDLSQGLADFFEVLDAQRSLLLSESALEEGRATLTTDTVALYKALGGGWQDSVDEVAAR